MEMGCLCIMQNKTDNLVYAGFFVRFAAYIADMLIVSAALLLVRLPVWFTGIINPGNFLVKDFVFKYSVADMLFYVLASAYFILLTYYTGSTLGKKLFNIRVISSEGRRYTFFEIVFRETVGRFLAKIILFAGYIMAGLDKQKRGLHDMLSDTCVIYCHERRVYVASPVYYKNMDTARQDVYTGNTAAKDNIEDGN